MIDGSAKDVIETSGCGRCVPAGDIQGLADAMKDFIQNAEKYKNWGDNGRKYFKNNFSKTKFMTRIEQEEFGFL